jgi:hypothetical protein
MKRVRHRWLGGLLAATVTFGTAPAAAASASLSVHSLSADQVATLACDHDIDASFITDFDASSGAHTVAVVRLTGVDAACDGSTLTIILAAGARTRLGSHSCSDPAGASGDLSECGGANQTVVSIDFTGRAGRA